MVIRTAILALSLVVFAQAALAQQTTNDPHEVSPVELAGEGRAFLVGPLFVPQSGLDTAGMAVEEITAGYRPMAADVTYQEGARRYVGLAKLLPAVRRGLESGNFGDFQKTIGESPRNGRHQGMYDIAGASDVYDRP